VLRSTVRLLRSRLQRRLARRPPRSRRPLLSGVSRARAIDISTSFLLCSAGLGCGPVRVQVSWVQIGLSTSLDDPFLEFLTHCPDARRSRARPGPRPRALELRTAPPPVDQARPSLHRPCLARRKWPSVCSLRCRARYGPRRSARAPSRGRRSSSASSTGSPVGLSPRTSRTPRRTRRLPRAASRPRSTAPTKLPLIALR
jgi:hypothetical protein